MRGEVHDENAFALGGAAGHAGLFGTIDGVLDAALALLQRARSGAGRHPRSASRPRARWAGRRGTTAGPAAMPCSDETIGHTGFTGTGLWIDFERGLAWTLLTNRVHPTRHRDTGIDALRRRVGDLIVRQRRREAGRRLAAGCCARHCRRRRRPRWRRCCAPIPTRWTVSTAPT